MSNAPSAQQPYKLSSMNNTNGSKKNNSMGVVTLLERGLKTNESEEVLVNMEVGQVTELIFILSSCAYNITTDRPGACNPWADVVG